MRPTIRLRAEFPEWFCTNEYVRRNKRIAVMIFAPG